MPPQTDSVYAARDYSSAPYLLKSVPLVLVFALICLTATRFADGKPQFAGWVGLAGCAIILAVLLWPTLFNAAPILSLTIAGLTYRSVSKTLMPWRDIQSIDVREHSFRHRMAKVRLPDSTVIWITKKFYERSIGNQSFFMRGPYWHDKLIFDGDRVGIVIPPEFVSASPMELFQAIDSRWRAFGTREAAARPISHVLLHESQSTAGTDRQGWLAIKLAVPIIGIAVVLANFAGIWETQGQKSSRERRERWAEEERRDREERRKSDEKWKKFWEDFDKQMSR